MNGNAAQCGVGGEEHMAENKLINKLMLICHAQVYFVHETAVELQPTVQTILVYETLPEELPAEICL